MLRGNIGYGGPVPPKGKPHRYFYKLYALDVAVDLAPGATKVQLVVIAWRDGLPSKR